MTTTEHSTTGLSITEQRNLATLARWADTYNNAVDAMCDLYAPDCEVRSMLTGMTLNGREALRKLEHDILAVQPQRRLEVVRASASGQVVAAECNGVFGATTFPAVVFLTFDDAGLIRSDHTYSPDPTGLTQT